MPEPKVILITDDNSVSLNIIKRLMKKLSPNTCILIVTGITAVVDLYTMNDDNIAMILTDLHFFTIANSKNTLQGLELIKIIRDFEKDTSVENPVPIIAFSSDETQKSAAIQAGADQFLVKPVNTVMLQKVLSTFVTPM